MNSSRNQRAKAGENYTLRAVQLDLARQPETLEYIFDFVDFIARFGYTHLFLYLEWRIRTATFRLAEKSFSYSLPEIRKIVKYASDQGIEVIPGFSFLGHAEHVLSCPEFEKFAELRGDRMGRFNTFRHVFCLSNPEVREFIRSYAHEVVPLFPGKFFHSGFDEAWDIGFCPACGKRAEKEGMSALFFDHLMFVHELVTKELGKTHMIWDDMLFYYSGVIEKLPREIILCPWRYEPIVERSGPIRPGSGASSEDDLYLYEKLGFRYLISPTVSSMENIQTYSGYATAGHSPYGALLTMWSSSSKRFNPAIAYAGKLWNPEYPSLTPEEAISETMPLRIPGCDSLIHLILSRGEYGSLPLSAKAYLKGSLSLSERERKLAVETLCAILEEYPPENDALDELFLAIRKEKFYFRMREFSMTMLDPKSKKDTNLSLKKAELKSLADAIHVQTQAIEKKFRPRGNPLVILEASEKLVKMVEQLPKKPTPAKAWLHAKFKDDGRFYLSVRCKGSTHFTKIPEALSSNSIFSGISHAYHPFDLSGEPEALRIEITHVYGGCRIMYANIETSHAEYLPHALLEVRGHVVHPEALLHNSNDCAYFGDNEQDVVEKFLHPSRIDGIFSVELLLKKVEF